MNGEQVGLSEAVLMNIGAAAEAAIRTRNQPEAKGFEDTPELDGWKEHIVGRKLTGFVESSLNDPQNRDRLSIWAVALFFNKADPEFTLLTTWDRQDVGKLVAVLQEKAKTVYGEEKAGKIENIWDAGGKFDPKLLAVDVFGIAGEAIEVLRKEKLLPEPLAKRLQLAEISENIHLKQIKNLSEEASDIACAVHVIDSLPDNIDQQLIKQSLEEVPPVVKTIFEKAQRLKGESGDPFDAKIGHGLKDLLALILPWKTNPNPLTTVEAIEKLKKEDQPIGGVLESLAQRIRGENIEEFRVEVAAMLAELPLLERMAVMLNVSGKFEQEIPVGNEAVHNDLFSLLFPELAGFDLSAKLARTKEGMLKVYYNALLPDKKSGSRQQLIIAALPLSIAANGGLESQLYVQDLEDLWKKRTDKRVKEWLQENIGEKEFLRRLKDPQTAIAINLANFLGKRKAFLKDGSLKFVWDNESNLLTISAEGN